MGSGSANFMITILKNNKNMLSKKRGRTSMSDYEKIKTEFKVEKAPPRLLRRIRVRIKSQQRKKDLILWTVLVVIMIILVGVFMYFY